jgi:hypothetical protein
LDNNPVVAARRCSRDCASGPRPPVSNDETIAIFAFLDAAQRSKESGGKPHAPALIDRLAEAAIQILASQRTIHA